MPECQRLKCVIVKINKRDGDVEGEEREEEDKIGEENHPSCTFASVC